jgi:hypothetical protein
VPDLLPRDLPWATWVTTPRVPAYAAAGPNDRLVVADPAWRARRPRPAGRPTASTSAGGRRCGRTPPRSTRTSRRRAEPHVALIVDTVPLDPPERLDEFSSHRLLWGAIRQELHDDPCAVGTDTSAYLRSRQRRFDLQGASLDRPLFLNHLIAPAVAQGVARRLISDGAPLRLHGVGWDSLPEFATRAAGLSPRAINSPAPRPPRPALLDARPAAWRNGMGSLGRPVIRCGGRTPQAVRHDVSLALAGRPSIEPPVPAISPAELLAKLTARS